MEKLHEVAFVSVGRAVGFAGLGILTVMISLSFDPVLALKSGGILLLILLAVLLLRTRRPVLRNFRDTEAWLLLDKADRPDEHYAARLLARALQDAYVWFARWIAGLACLVWIAAVTLSVLGVGAETHF